MTLGDLTPSISRSADGSVVMRAAQPLGHYPATLTDSLEEWGRKAPERTLLAWRPRPVDRAETTAPGEPFARLTFADAVTRMRCLGQALLDRSLSAERPLAILSGNSVEHLMLALAAQHVGVLHAPISPAYSLVSRDYGSLKYVLSLLSAGVVFVSDPALFAPALDAALAPDVEIVHPEEMPVPARVASRWRTSTFESWLQVASTSDVDRRHAAIQPDEPAKILFTSGSTGTPKGVINTHRMICSNQQMILQALPCLGEEPPVLVDWLPWHHTFGGNHNVGIVVYNGGSLYLDEGRPLPGAFEESVRNLRDVAPTIYLNVPKGYEELVRAFRKDPELARSFFARVRVLFYAAAGLSQHVADELQEIAVEACGERVVLVTGLGATETAPMAICRPWPSTQSSAIGLPVPGTEAKLTHVNNKLEMRIKGPSVTPGYWHREDLTREAFDEEGFFCMGDAVRPVDASDLGKGLVFDGRIKEDFKLSTGTWVSVGPLRARILTHFAPFVRDVVIAGHDRDEVGMLIVPDVEACRAICASSLAGAPACDVLRDSAVAERLSRLLASFAASATGSASRIARALVLEEPPSLDGGEVTDKGSLNQAAILRRRQGLVEQLYAATPGARVIRAESLHES